MTPHPYAPPVATIAPVEVAEATRPPMLTREFAKYFAASAAALAVDASVLALCVRVGLSYRVAGGAGFLAGLAVSYALSVLWVFAQRSLKNRVAEFALFAGVGVAGLGLTELILWCEIDGFGWNLAVAKFGSAACVFLFNFGVRKVLLFPGRRA